MKNTIKKAICTALAAVSLSAMVTVPSSLNAPKADNTVVNVMEAEAKFEPYEAFLTNGEHYYVRSSRKRTENGKPYDKNIIRKDLYNTFTVYEETGDWVRISPDHQKQQEWVWRSRVRKVDKSVWNKCEQLHGKGSRRPTGYVRGVDFITRIVNKQDKVHTICTKCGKKFWEIWNY